MKLEVFVLQDIFRKYLCHRDFLEKYNAENLQDFAQTQLDFEFFLDNSRQDVNADSYPDLGLDGIDAGAEKGFDSQILLYPFEKDFYLPTVLVKPGDYQSRQ